MSKLCSAKGQTCHKCKKLNHYARVCRSNNADRQRSTHNQTWPSARQSNPTTKQKIQLVKPENETVSSESSTSEDEYLYTPVTPTHCKKWHSTKHGLDPWTGPKIGPKIGLKILAKIGLKILAKILPKNPLFFQRETTLRISCFDLICIDKKLHVPSLFLDLPCYLSSKILYSIF
jgi:hypothetical protein